MKSIPSKTVKVVVGCGAIYITLDYNEDNSLHKVYMQRTNKLHCSPSVLTPLFKSCTYTSRRDIKQAIKDYEGSEVDACEKFNIGIKSKMKQGELCAYSCSDAIARVLKSCLLETEVVKREPEMKPLGIIGKEIE
jgi:hypothetical protein